MFSQTKALVFVPKGTGRGEFAPDEERKLEVRYLTGCNRNSGSLFSSTTKILKF